MKKLNRMEEAARVVLLEMAPLMKYDERAKRLFVSCDSIEKANEVKQAIKVVSPNNQLDMAIDQVNDIPTLNVASAIEGRFGFDSLGATINHMATMGINVVTSPGLSRSA